MSCSIGATLGNGGWSTLLNSARGPLQINGQPPIPPPDIPEERLNFPPIPLPDLRRRRPDRAAAPTTRPVTASSNAVEPIHSVDSVHPARSAVRRGHLRPRRRRLAASAAPAGTGQHVHERSGPPGEAPPPPGGLPRPHRARHRSRSAAPAARGAPAARAGRTPGPAPGPAPGRTRASTTARGVIRWPCG